MTGKLYGTARAFADARQKSGMPVGEAARGQETGGGMPIGKLPRGQETDGGMPVGEAARGQETDGGMPVEEADGNGRKEAVWIFGEYWNTRWQLP